MKTLFEHSLLSQTCLTLFTVACGAPVFAQTVDTNNTPAPTAEHRLSDVIVTGNPLATTNLIATTAVLTGAELLLRKKSSLGETLDGTPGVSSTYFGPVASRPTIRGQDGDRIRILQNGGASIDASGLSFDHATPVDPLVIERIEVLRGPGALQYGGSAVGGVVNVINNRIGTEPLFDEHGGVTGRAELRVGGADGERGGSALLETGTDKFALHVDGFERKTADVRVPIALACDKAGTGMPSLSKRLCNSASQSSGGAVGGTAFFDRGYLGASIETFKTSYGSVAEDTVNIDMHQNRYALQGEVRGLEAGSLGLLQSVKGQWSGINYEHTELTSNVPGTVFRNAGHDFRLEARQAKVATAWGALNGQIGLQVEGNRFSAAGDEAFAPNTHSTTQALFAQEELGTAWASSARGGGWRPSRWCRWAMPTCRVSPRAAAASTPGAQPWGACGM